MDLSSEFTQRWVINKIDRDASYLARRMAVKYQVQIGEVVMEALAELDEYLSEGGDIPDGWRTV